jgi:hypothetical protein
VAPDSDPARIQALSGRPARGLRLARDSGNEGRVAVARPRSGRQNGRPRNGPEEASMETKKKKHPHFDDRGTLSWHTSWKDALADARQGGKMIFIELGREL